jgi:tetratricopeptide (TPR) repeat protein
MSYQIHDIHGDSVINKNRRIGMQRRSPPPSVRQGPAAGSADMGTPHNPPAGRSAREELAAALKLRERGQIRAAQQSLEALVNAVPSYLAAWTALGELQFMMQNDAGAMACFHRAAMLAGNDYPTLINLARCYLSIRATDLAEGTLRAAERIEPEAWQTHLGFARLWISRGDFDKALDSISRVRKLKPDHV